MPWPKSSISPPRNDEYRKAVPLLFSFVTNASESLPPYVVWNAPAVVGKAGEDVSPVT